MPKTSSPRSKTAKPILVADLEFTSFEVKAYEKWQDTGIDVVKNKGVLIQEDKQYWNQWVISKAVRCGPQGDSRYIAKPGYSLPGRYEGALIAKIGNEIEFIGAKGEFVPSTNGRLYLIANDDLDGIYGEGFKDNAFSVKVLISPRP